MINIRLLNRDVRDIYTLVDLRHRVSITKHLVLTDGITTPYEPHIEIRSGWWVSNLEKDFEHG